MLETLREHGAYWVFVFRARARAFELYRAFALIDGAVRGPPVCVEQPPELVAVPHFQVALVTAAPREAGTEQKYATRFSCA